MSARRILAIVLPELACELVRQCIEVVGPLGVIVVEQAASAPGELPSTALLDAACGEARRHGVRPGQRVAEAAALVGKLAVHLVTRAELEAARARVAEIALSLGTTAALALSEREGASVDDAPLDVVWLDVTGAAHLVGGEGALLEVLAERLRPLGHRVRLALAEGPRLAHALARFGASGDGFSLAEEGLGAEALAPLPLNALPVSADVIAFFARLGVRTVGELARLPRAGLAARLGARSKLVLELLAGRDPSPLVPWAPPRVLVEEQRFEEGIEGAESLLFVLRAMASRIAARLSARGEAAARLEVALPLDRSIARLREAPESAGFHVDLPAPLSEAEDLLRALKAKLERTELLAPAVGITLSVPQIVEARRVQLDLSRGKAIDPDVLPALLAELSAEIGPERVGVLEVVDAHAPEARSRLVPVGASEPHAPAASPALVVPTRLLPKPVVVDRLEAGARVRVEQGAYAVVRAAFAMRLEGIGWWTASPVSRDYVRAWLASEASRGAPVVVGEAFAYVDRSSGDAVIHGWLE